MLSDNGDNAQFTNSYTSFFPVVRLAAGRAGAMTGLILLPGGQAYVIRPCLLYTLRPVAQDRLDGIWRLIALAFK